MNKIIHCRVNDEYILDAGVPIGAAGSSNDVALSLDFNDMWVGLSIVATFISALGTHTTVVPLMPSMLENGATMTYLVPIPPEAKSEEGRCKLTLSGYSVTRIGEDGKLQYVKDSLTNTTTAFFRVLPSDASLFEDTGIQPTLAEMVVSELNEFQETIDEWFKLEEGRENGRIEAEDARRDAESLREAAEEKRQEYYENLTGLTVSCSETFVGARGYYIRAIYFDPSADKGKIYLSQEQVVPTFLSNEYADNETFETAYDAAAAKGKSFCLVADENYDADSTCKATITDITGNVVSFNGYFQCFKDGEGGKVTAGYAANMDKDTSSIDDFSFMIPSQADVGAHIVRDRASAIGVLSKALGIAAVALGAKTFALGKYAHAQGCLSEALAYCSTAEGYGTKAKGMSSHAEGFYTEALGNQSHAEGGSSKAIGNSSHAEGNGAKAGGAMSHAEGAETNASGDRSHAEGSSSEASGYASHAEGLETIANNQACHTEGYQTKATGWICHAEGNGSIASGPNGSHGEGHGTKASGESSHSEGKNTSASAASAHAEGSSTTASGDSAHAEGSSTIASGPQSHAEGKGTTASGSFPGAHAEGLNTTASSNAAHAEGENSKATGWISHAEGNGCQAKGPMSHAEGQGSVVEEGGITAHAEGIYTVANTNGQHVQGRYNLPDSTMAHIVGSGTSENDRKNIHTIDWSGNAFFAGYIKIGNTIITEAQLKKLLALLG